MFRRNALSLLAAPFLANAALASPGCDAVNAIGRINVSPIPGGTVVLGPFSGFDEGIHEQPADGDTLRVARVGDLAVTVTFQSVLAASVDITPPRRFATHVIASPGSPEGAAMTITVRTVATPQANPQVAVGCTGTPNPGRDPVGAGGAPGVPAAPAVVDAVVEETRAEIAEDLNRFGIAPADLPSLMTTPAPGNNDNPDERAFDRFIDRMDRRYTGGDRAVVDQAIDAAAGNTSDPAAAEALIRALFPQIIQRFGLDIDRIILVEELDRARDDRQDARRGARGQIRAAAEAGTRAAGVNATAQARRNGAANAVADLFGWDTDRERGYYDAEIQTLVDYALGLPSVDRGDSRDLISPVRSLDELIDELAREADPERAAEIDRLRARAAALNQDQGAIFFDVTISALYNRERLIREIAELIDLGGGNDAGLSQADLTRMATALVNGLDDPGLNIDAVADFDRARARAEAGDYAEAAAILDATLRGDDLGATRGDQARARYYGTNAFGTTPVTDDFDDDIIIQDGETALFSEAGANTATFSLDSATVRRAMRVRMLRFSDAAAAEFSPLDHRFWARGRVSLHDGNSQGMNGTSYELQGGAVMKLDRDWEAGTFVTFFNSDLRSNAGTDFETKAAGLGLYANHHLSPTLYFGLSAAIEGGDTRKQAGAVTARYSYDKHALAASLRGVVQRETWLLQPSASVSWTRRDTHAHTDSVGTVFAKRTTETLNLTGALAASRSRDYAGRRYERITSQYRIAAHYYDRSLPAGTSDPVAGLELGANWNFGYAGGASLLLGSAVGGIGQDTQIYNFSAAVNVPF